MTETQASRVPPYVSFRTLLTQIERMGSEGVPTQIDKYFLTGMAGGTQNHFRHALRVLGLIDENNRTTDLLRSLAAADVDARKTMMASILHNGFPELVALGTDASKSDFLDVLSTYGAKGADSQRKSLAFFVAAAEYAGVPVSTHVKSGRAPIGSSTPRRTATRRTKNTGSASARDDGTGDRTDQAAPQGYSRTVELKSGGTVTLTWDVNMAYSTQEDEDFVMGLVRTLRSYQTGAGSGKDDAEDGEA